MTTILNEPGSEEIFCIKLHFLSLCINDVSQNMLKWHLGIFQAMYYVDKTIHVLDVLYIGEEIIVDSLF